jgi:capsular exopolysaccharide synthesis family protein
MVPARRFLNEGTEFDAPLAARRLVGRLYKRKHQIAIVFVLVLIPAAIATYLTKPLYRATALVQVNPDPVQVLPYRDVADAVAGGGNYDSYMGTQDQILRGAGLRLRVAGRLQNDFKDQPIGEEIARVGDGFSVKKIENSELFELSYLGPSPATAMAMVNLFAEEYVKQNFDMRQGTRVKAEENLKRELQSLEQRLQLSEKELTTYAQGNNIMSLEQGQVDPLQERLRALNQELGQSEIQVAMARSSYETLQKATLDDFPQRLVSEQITQLEGKLLTLEQDLTTLRATFGENWPAVVEKRNEATLVRQQLAREKSAVLARHLEQARLDLQGTEARKKLAVDSLRQHESLVNQFHNASIQYNILKREVDTNRNLYDGLLERLRQTGVMAGFQFGNIQVIEPGRARNVADSPKVFWNLGLASLLGLALGVCFVILLDTWDDSVSTLDEADQLAGLPALGSVPLINAAKPPRALLPARASARALPDPSLSPAESAAVTESVRAVCASILLSRSDERPRVIVVTSAMPSEGKTTLVTHLGRAFAEAGLSTLLIEADLRKPDLSKAFSIGNEDGLSLYLAGHVSPWPKIHETDIPNLYLAAGGPVPPNPAALFHSDRLSLFLKAAVSEYQIVLVDSPPMSISDARILGTKADGVVLVVRAGRTAKTLVRRAWATLETSGANVLGMVLNGEQPHSSSMGYYGYYTERAS